MPVVTLVRLNVRRTVAVLVSTVTTLPTVPVMLQVSIVPKLLEKRIVWATVLVDASSVNEFAPDIDVTDIPVEPPIVSLLNDRPPPAKVLLLIVVLESKMLAVCLLKVRPVVVAVLQTVPVPLNVHRPDPIVIVLELLLLEEKTEQVRL